MMFDLDYDKLQDKLKSITKLSQQIAITSQRKDQLTQHIASLEQQIRKVDSRITGIRDKAIDMDEAERVIRYALRSQQTMRAFKELVIKQKVAALTRHVEEALDVLTRKDGLVVRVGIDPETLRISLYDSQQREVPKARLSSGEKQMLAVALLWGLARASGRRLPVIIDTPMGRLDSSHRMNFVAKYLPNASHQVIVLSTDTEIIGPYLSSLEPHIGRQYLLSYSDDQQRTRVADGYFESAGVATNDC